MTSTQRHKQSTELTDMSSLCSLLRVAERSLTPWAAWRKGGMLMICLGGEVSDYKTEHANALSQDRLLYRDETLVLGQAKTVEIEALICLAPRRLTLRRFSREDSHLEVNVADSWLGWGEEGSIWLPSISIVYDIERAFGVLCQRDIQEAPKLLLKLISLSTRVVDEPLQDPTEPSNEVLELKAQERYESWQERVELATEQMRTQTLSKVVFARSWRREAPKGMEWSGAALWLRCLDNSSRDEVPFALSPQGRSCFVGVSPERLFELQDDLVKTHALAGTRRVSKDAQVTAELAEELAGASKDIEEHEIVVDQIKHALTPLCKNVTCLTRRVKRARSLLHLETPIEGKFDKSTSAHVLMEQLHPTPALGGAPSSIALALIQRYEPMKRGGYAAPWMWESAEGSACAVVGIRSVLLNGKWATIYAGAGIVEGSSPEAEWRETRAKAEVINALLTIDTLRAVSSSHAPESIECRQQRRCLRLVEELRRSGLVGAVISPGSRNTPLALALDHLLPSLVTVDERSAGFTALGWAKASGGAVALCCTSGSALAHYFPALIEARYSAVPLVVLSADRPPRLRDRGAPQTVEQAHIFGAYCKDAVDLPSEEAQMTWLESTELDLLWCNEAHRLTELSLEEHRGAVHLNLPFEEPLWSADSEQVIAQWPKGEQRRPPLRAKLKESPRLNKDLLQAFSKERGVIYCGPVNPIQAKEMTETLAMLSQLTGWPICAEGSSQLRGRIETVQCIEELARAKYLPSGTEVDVILTLGAHTHSRAVRAWFESCGNARHYWLGDGKDCIDPNGLGVERLGATLSEGLAILQALTSTAIDEHKQTEWARKWRLLEESAKAARSKLKVDMLWGAAIGEEISEALNELRRGHHRASVADLVIASSMAFRDHDMTWSPQLPTAQSLLSGPADCWVSRGANGIDGTLSTALGVSIASVKTDLSKPLVVWVGDLAAHHDLQGLHRLSAWAREAQRAVLVMITNNQGGGIFHHLPIRDSERFEPLFFTPLVNSAIEREASRSWEAIAKWCGAASFHSVDRRQVLREILRESLERSGLSLIELVYHAQSDRERHQMYWSELKRSLQELDERGEL